MKLKLIAEVQYKQPSTSMARGNMAGQYTVVDINGQTSEVPHPKDSHPRDKNIQRKLRQRFRKARN